MQTVDELLDAIKSRHQITSDYKLARYLDMTDSAIRNYRHKRSLPDEVACVKIAQALDLDGDVLAAQIQAQRARDEDTKAFWQRLAVRLETGTVHVALAFVVAFLALLGTSPNAHATVTDLSASVSKSSVYYVNWLMRLAATLRAFFRRSRHSTFDSMREFVTKNLHVQSAYAAPAGLVAA